MSKKFPPIHGTTVLCVRRDNKVVIAADGQVTMGEHVMKHTARKTRRLFNDKVLAGFAGSTADALSLFERFEGKLQEHHGNLAKSAVELAKEWRKDRALRHLEALLIVADAKGTFLRFRQWRRDRAGRRHLRHRLGRAVRAGGGAGAGQAHQACARRKSRRKPCASPAKFAFIRMRISRLRSCSTNLTSSALRGLVRMQVR